MLDAAVVSEFQAEENFMRFLKTHSYDIVKLFINQIGIMVFSLVLYAAIGSVDDKYQNMVRLYVSIFSILFYCALLYNIAWEHGANDKIRVESGKMKPFKLKGAVLSLYANVLNFIIAICASVFMGVHLATASEWSYSAFNVFNIIMRFLSSMYIGVLSSIFAHFESNINLYYFWQSVGFFFCAFVSVIATQIGYWFGRKEWRIFGWLNTGKKNKGQ